MIEGQNIAYASNCIFRNNIVRAQIILVGITNNSNRDGEQSYMFMPTHTFKMLWRLCHNTQITIAETTHTMEEQKI